MRKPHNDRLGSDTAERSPERKCILSGDTAAREGLVRLALSPPGPDGRSVVLPDVLAKAPGRGAWIGVTRTQLETAISKGHLKGALARAHKGAPLDIPADLADRIEAALVRALSDRLGLEARAGNLLWGSDRIAEHARAGRVEWLAHARDASPDGSRKLDQALRVGLGAEGSGLTGIVLPLDRAALSVALGRDNVVHLALTDRGAARRVASLAERLQHFQGQAEAGPDEDRAPPRGHGQAQDASPATTN